MGTRNLTVVISGGAVVVAQYCQWDGYPDGQGATVLNFIQKELIDGKNEAAFKQKLENVEWITDEEFDERWKICGSNGSGWVTFDVSNKMKELWPELQRDCGANVLSIIMGSNREIKLKNNFDFGEESLFCEWAYVIDMDKRELVCYVGFNKKPVSEGLWANRKPDDGYYSVAPIKTYSFDELPSREKFIEELNTIRNN